jgi:hypothetical protein
MGGDAKVTILNRNTWQLSHNGNYVFGVFAVGTGDGTFMPVDCFLGAELGECPNPFINEKGIGVWDFVNVTTSTLSGVDIQQAGFKFPSFGGDSNTGRVGWKVFLLGLPFSFNLFSGIAVKEIPE